MAANYNEAVLSEWAYGHKQCDVSVAVSFGAEKEILRSVTYFTDIINLNSHVYALD